MSENSVEERRHLERFPLKATAVIETAVENEEKVLELYTRDISSSGAFFSTQSALPPGASVRITLFLLIAGLKQLYGHPGKIKITTDGTVVRSNNDGMAVVFDQRYQMSAVTS
jgi:hypothetical protein